MIVRNDYVIPPKAGADKVSTKEGEGLEIVQLLARLMDKNPETRITLAEVKVRSFRVLSVGTHLRSFTFRLSLPLYSLFYSTLW